MNLKPGGCEPLSSFSLPGAFFYSVAFARGMLRLHAATEGVTGHIKTSFQKNQRLEYYPTGGDFFSEQRLNLARETEQLPSRNKGDACPERDKQGRQAGKRERDKQAVFLSPSKRGFPPTDKLRNSVLNAEKNQRNLSVGGEGLERF